MKALGKLLWSVGKDIVLPAGAVLLCGLGVLVVVRLITVASRADAAEELACARLCGVHRVLLCGMAYDPSWQTSRRVVVCASESGVRAGVE